MLEITSGIECWLGHLSPHELGFADRHPVVVRKPDSIARSGSRRKVLFRLELELVGQLPEYPGKLVSAVGTIEGFVVTVDRDDNSHMASEAPFVYY
jgi:hypothetical protein